MSVVWKDPAPKKARSGSRKALVPRYTLTEGERHEYQLLLDAVAHALQQHDSGNGVSEFEAWRVSERVRQVSSIHHRILAAGGEN